MRIRDAKRALEGLKSAEKKIIKMNKKYSKIYKESLDEIGKSVIARWYATYDPVYYDRKRSLYHVYKISMNDNRLKIVFDKEYLDEFIDRQYNEWIYENTFKRGYHGGAIPGGVSSGRQKPYWRTPFPELTYWGRPAKLSFSPYKVMCDEMNNEFNKIRHEQIQEYNKIMEKVEKQILKII